MILDLFVEFLEYISAAESLAIAKAEHRQRLLIATLEDEVKQKREHFIQSCIAVDEKLMALQPRS